MKGKEGLIVRDAARFDIALHARFRIGPEHQTVVRFSQAAGVRDGWPEAEVVDLSAHGVGLVSGVFVPRGCRLELRVFGAAKNDLLFSIPCTVRRVVMTDRRPAYLLGLAFETSDGSALRQIRALLEQLETTAD